MIAYPVGSRWRYTEWNATFTIVAPPLDYDDGRPRIWGLFDRPELRNTYRTDGYHTFQPNTLAPDPT